MTRDKRLMRTYPTGQWVNPADVQLDQLDIRDIAHHLSNINRYTGATAQPYSVAQHCVLVMALLAYNGCSRAVQLAGLMHDASEAYLGDVGTPLKCQLADYKLLEMELEHRIEFRFRLQRDPATRMTVKAADYLAYLIEARDLQQRDDIEVTSEILDVPLMVLRATPAWRAKQTFLQAFISLLRP